MVTAIKAAIGRRHGPGYCAIGFAAGLAVAGTIYGSLLGQIHDAGMGLALFSGAFALAGAIAGALIGIRRGRGAARLDALATALALGSGLFMTGMLYETIFEPRLSGEWMITAVYLFRFAAIGMMVGALPGIFRGAWRDVPRLAAYGGMGFALGALALDRFGTWLAGPLALLVPGFVGDPLHDGATRAVTWGVSFALAGLVAGAIIGVALEKSESQPLGSRLTGPSLP
jgi:hypothetical protein